MRERMSRLLNILTSRKFTTVKDLSLQLNVTPKTIRNEVKALNELLASNQLPDFIVKQGVVINKLTDQQSRYFAQQALLKNDDRTYLTPQQRIVYLLLVFLTADKPVFLVSIQVQLVISKSTMDSDMRSFRSLLQQYNLRLTTAPKRGACIVGNERSIRMMFSDVLSRDTGILNIFSNKLIDNNILNTKIKQTFDMQDINYIKQHIISIFSYSALATNDNYLQQAIILTLVWINRVQNNHYLNGDDNAQLTISSEQYNYVQLILNHFHLSNPGNDEIRYLAFLIGSFINDKNKSLDNWIRAQIISVALIEWMEQKLVIPFSQDEDLFERVYQHISSLLQRLDQKINVFNPLKTTIKQSYSSTFKAVKQFVHTNKNRYQLELSDDEIGFLTIYFSAAQSKLQQKQIYKYRIAIVCNYGLATGRLLGVELEKHFNVEVMAVLSTQEIGVLNKLPVSFVFKTVNVDIQKIPSIKISPILTKSDFDLVKRFLSEHADFPKYEEKSLDPTKLFTSILETLKANQYPVNKNLVYELKNVFQNNNLNVNGREVQPMLKDLIKDSQIQLQINAKNWQDAIKIAAQPLLNQGFINSDYIQAMVDSVKKYGPYIVIGPSIALAHARPEDGAIQLGVSLATLKQPIDFGNSENDPVKIVFCLAAVDSYSHLNVMKAIVQLINDQDKIKHLSKITKLNEFRQVLFDESISKEV